MYGAGCGWGHRHVSTPLHLQGWACSPFPPLCCGAGPVPPHPPQHHCGVGPGPPPPPHCGARLGTFPPPHCCLGTGQAGPSMTTSTLPAPTCTILGLGPPCLPPSSAHPMSPASHPREGQVEVCGWSATTHYPVLLPHPGIRGWEVRPALLVSVPSVNTVPAVMAVVCCSAAAT